jgi:hypothetical protein
MLDPVAVVHFLHRDIEAGFFIAADELDHHGEAVQLAEGVQVGIGAAKHRLLENDELGLVAVQADVSQSRKARPKAPTSSPVFGSRRDPQRMTPDLSPSAKPVQVARSRARVFVIYSSCSGLGIGAGGSTATESIPLGAAGSGQGEHAEGRVLTKDLRRLHEPVAIAAVELCLGRLVFAPELLDLKQVLDRLFGHVQLFGRGGVGIGDPLPDGARHLTELTVQFEDLLELLDRLGGRSRCFCRASQACRSALGRGAVLSTAILGPFGALSAAAAFLGLAGFFGAPGGFNLPAILFSPAFCDAPG